jgi:hypothetical protein
LRKKLAPNGVMLLPSMTINVHIVHENLHKLLQFIKKKSFMVQENLHFSTQKALLLISIHGTFGNDNNLVHILLGYFDLPKYMLEIQGIENL